MSFKASAPPPTHRPATIATRFAAKLTISVAIALLAVGSLTGCVSTASDKLAKRLKVNEPVIRVYYAKYEEVEAALKQAMLKYPQRVDNTESGIFESDFVKGEARFQAPHESPEFSSGYRYRIIVRLVRGQSSEKPAVKVVVTKQIELARDFFADPEQLASDGLEENVIHYRIARELTITRALTKAQENANRKRAD